jgi:hypothetical protein
MLVHISHLLIYVMQYAMLDYLVVFTHHISYLDRLVVIFSILHIGNTQYVIQ